MDVNIRPTLLATTRSMRGALQGLNWRVYREIEIASVARTKDGLW